MGLFNYLRTQLLGVDLDETQRASDEADVRVRFAGPPLTAVGLKTSDWHAQR